MDDRAPAPQPPVFNSNAYSPAEIKEAVEKVGVKKARLPFAGVVHAGDRGGRQHRARGALLYDHRQRRGDELRYGPRAGRRWRFRLGWYSCWLEAPSCLRATT